MSIVTIGIDLAKHIFAVHGVNEGGHAELVKPKVSRDQLLPLMANLPKNASKSSCAYTARDKVLSKSVPHAITDCAA